MKDRYAKGNKHVGQFVRNGNSKWIPAWMERQAIPIVPAAETMTIKRTWTLKFNLWNLLRWAIIIALVGYLFQTCNVSVAI